MKGEYTCEAVVAYDTTIHPRLIKCGKPAKLRGIAAVCDTCWEAMQLIRKARQEQNEP